MKLGEHKVKIKTCRRSIKRALSNDLKLVLFKTAREHIREIGSISLK